MTWTAFQTTALEQSILAEVRARTGLSFRKIAGIDTRDPGIAQAVLPVIKDLLGRVGGNDRRDLFARFHTPEAYAYLDDVLSWWTNEQDEQSLSGLSQVLTLLVKDRDAVRVWRLCQELPKRPFHYMLLSKLATLPSVEREVKETLVQDLNAGAFGANELFFVARVHDPRIQRWFEGQRESPDPKIRQIAKRVAAKGSKWPKEVEYASTLPDRRMELYSVEGDLEELKELLAPFAKTFQVKIPVAIKAGSFLASAEVDRWIIAHIADAAGNPFALWFRLEDIDTVEIVLLKRAVELATVH